MDPESDFASIADAATAYAETAEEEAPVQDNLEPETTDEGTTPDDEIDPALVDEEGDAKDEDDDGSEPEPAGGRFVSDDAKVKLADGTVTTVAELRKGNLFNADYTRKAMALAEDRKAVESQKASVSQLESALAQQRETIAAVVDAFMPKPPDPSLIQSDFIGYQMQKDAYERQTQIVNRLIGDHQQMQARQQQEQAAQLEAARKSEAQKLLEKAPELAKPEVYQKFWADAVELAASVGITAEELGGLGDHRQYLVLKDAIAYRRLKAKHAEAKAKTAGKPPVLQGSNRRSPESVRQQSSSAALERLNKTGSVKDAVAALIALEER